MVTSWFLLYYNIISHIWWYSFYAWTGTCPYPETSDENLHSRFASPSSVALLSEAHLSWVLSLFLSKSSTFSPHQLSSGSARHPQPWSFLARFFSHLFSPPPTFWSHFPCLLSFPLWSKLSFAFCFWPSISLYLKSIFAQSPSNSPFSQHEHHELSTKSSNPDEFSQSAA